MKWTIFLLLFLSFFSDSFGQRRIREQDLSSSLKRKLSIQGREGVFANDYSKFSDALQVANDNSLRLYVTTAETITSSETLTLNADASLEIHPGGSIANEGSFTLNGQIDAPDYLYWVKGAGTWVINKSATPKASIWWFDDVAGGNETAAWVAAKGAIAIGQVSIWLPTQTIIQDSVWFIDAHDGKGIDYDGLTLEGDGPWSSIIARDDSLELYGEYHVLQQQGAAIVAHAVDSLTFKDFQMDGRLDTAATTNGNTINSRTTAGAIRFRADSAACDNATVQNMVFINHAGDSNVIDTNLAQRFLAKDVIIEADLTGIGTSGINGIEMDDCIDCKIEGGSLTAGKYGASLYSGNNSGSAGNRNNQIHNVEFRVTVKPGDSGAGLQLTSQGGQTMNNVIVSDCRFQGQPSRIEGSPTTYNIFGVVVEGGTGGGNGYLGPITIKDSQFDSLHIAVWIKESGLTDHIEIKDVVISNGLSPQDDDGAITIEKTQSLDGIARVRLVGLDIKDVSNNGIYADSVKFLEIADTRIDSSDKSSIFLGQGTDPVWLSRLFLHNPGLSAANNPDSLTSGIWASDGVDSLRIDDVYVDEYKNAGSPTKLYSGVSIAENTEWTHLSNIVVPKIRAGGTKVEIRNSELGATNFEFMLRLMNTYSQFNAPLVFAGVQDADFDLDSYADNVNSVVVWFSPGLDTLWAGKPSGNAFYLKLTDSGSGH